MVFIFRCCKKCNIAFALSSKISMVEDLYNLLKKNPPKKTTKNPTQKSVSTNLVNFVTIKKT